MLDGSHDVKMSWRDGRTLVVDLPSSPARIQQQDESAGVVYIVYRSAGAN